MQIVFLYAAVDCGKLSPPLNGSVVGDKSTFPNQVEITCDKGFILRGERRRSCQANGTWGGETTVCEGSKIHFPK